MMTEWSSQASWMAAMVDASRGWRSSMSRTSAPIWGDSRDTLRRDFVATFMSSPPDRAAGPQRATLDELLPAIQPRHGNGLMHFHMPAELLDGLRADATTYARRAANVPFGRWKINSFTASPGTRPSVH